MKLSDLFQKKFPAVVHGSAELEIGGLAYDSRRVEPGDAFFALRGAAVDGHRFVADAVARGARAVIAEDLSALPEAVTGVLVEDSRRALALAASAFYNDPTADIPVIGVTGTNGKTTVSYLLEAILRAAGRRPAVFGTINYRFADRHLPAPHTTPESLDLLRMVADFRAAGADALIMEVSSHALAQSRVDGIHFDVGVFTNLTPEHLDYHGDMDTYFTSKRRFFDELLPAGEGRAVINVDDPFGRRLADTLPGGLRCSSEAGVGQVHPLELTIDLDGIRGRLAVPDGEITVESPLLGPFNAQNLICAAAAGIALGLEPAVVARGLAQCPPVPGRLERIENDREALVLVDYAHTGDALDKVLTAVGQLQPRRIITVFGCGGDRDRGKRPVMGEVAARYSDLTIMTSDNPRGEDPLAILAEIRPGVLRACDRELTQEQARQGGRKGFLTIPDRRAAIDFAVSLLGEGDLLLVAGKGHEDYQVVGNRRLHFDDREELRRALRAGKVEL
jgi:UDP-N-acetylmuramoyl-L-alanyl-D-glutamate--2,6-diaminopimelate ligase